MPEIAPRYIAGLLLVAIAIVPFWLPKIVLPSVHLGNVEVDFEGGSALFVGDVMLGRHVETLTRRHGMQYPFLGTVELLKDSDVTIGNFEGTVPKEHSQTPEDSYQFSIDRSFMPVLSEVGFDILSLANNHALDYGESAYRNTHSECHRNGLRCTGHPDDFKKFGETLFSLGESTVGLISLYGHPLNIQDIDKLANTLKSVREKTDVQFVYIHWGEEYELKHSDHQEALAHFFIDQGVDAVIGHHPHVVQDIEIYKEKPIFYSLGNFVFDQYFDETVERGLALKVSIDHDTVYYELIPLESSTAESQPRVMDSLAGKEMLHRISSSATPASGADRVVLSVLRW